MKNLIVLFGGGGNEHDISKKSKEYLVSQIESHINVFEVEIRRNGEWTLRDEVVYLTSVGLLNSERKLISSIDYVIPCIHGRPGEDGQIQGMLELLKIPFLGCKAQESLNCFNKLTTKSLLDNFAIPTVPFVALHTFKAEIIDKFFKEHKNIFVKANSEGSSVGCYHPKSLEQAYEATKEAFKYSKFVLLEKFIKGRELEVAAFEFDGQIHLSRPGEIITADKFYDFEEKYSQTSKARIEIVSQLKESEISKIQDLARRAFEVLNLRHLSRIDFFMDDNQIYINEINTFPGMTEISLFPKMMENYGVKFHDFLKDAISKSS